MRSSKLSRDLKTHSHDLPSPCERIGLKNTIVISVLYSTFVAHGTKGSSKMPECSALPSFSTGRGHPLRPFPEVSRASGCTTSTFRRPNYGSFRMRASGEANADILRRIKEAKEYKRERDSQVPIDYIQFPPQTDVSLHRASYLTR